jgi:hypothetical protein
LLTKVRGAHLNLQISLLAERGIMRVRRMLGDVADRLQT